ncbi:MAG: hypothetical protein B6I30_09920 [Desulfobacteraceae bacterium 4572_187]|nr:MAG: hypothetical protein B6I30_09920 [Desulfobacteraceae bacterium 4572_187]
MKKRRKKDVASSQLQFCYSGEDLLRYRTGKIPPEMRARIYYHLNVEKCGRCRDIYPTIQVSQEESAPTVRKDDIIRKLRNNMGKYNVPPVPLRLDKFQVWTTSPEPRSLPGEVVDAVPMGVPVLIISPGDGRKNFGNIIRVLPISNDTGFHLEGETFLINENSPLKYPILVEIFNETPMLAGNLGEYRGALSDAQSKKIHDLRNRYLDGVEVKPDQQYLEWKQKEMKLTRYLAFPVNERLWSDAVENEADTINTIDIHLVPYRMAADAGGVELSEIAPHILAEEDSFSLAIVQKRDQALLRFHSDTLEPEEILIDAKKVQMNKKGSGFFEVMVGYSSGMPESMVIVAVVEGSRFVFKLTFNMRHDA